MKLIIAALVLKRVLLPIVANEPLPGAHGSLWKTEVVVRNASGQVGFFAPPSCEPNVPWRFCAFNTSIAPNITFHPYFRTEAPARPVVLSVEEAIADRVHVQLRVRDVSREADSFGVELPVVRSEEQLRGDSQILDLPIDPRFRITLRVYAFDVRETAQLEVRIVGEARGGARTLRYEMRPLPIPESDFPELYQQLDFLESLPELAGETKARVEVHPSDPDARYWAMVTVTNNATQHLTTLTPQ